MKAEDIVERIKKTFPDAKVKAYDLTGGGDHWQLRVETAAFTGKSLVQQHQMVYGALGEWMKAEIHALKLDTATPKD
jgi:stress-induced morphogen